MIFIYLFTIIYISLIFHSFYQIFLIVFNVN